MVTGLDNGIAISAGNSAGNGVSAVRPDRYYIKDEQGLDSKVVLSLPAPERRPLHEITSADQQRSADFFGVVYVTKAVLPIVREKHRGHLFCLAEAAHDVTREDVMRATT